MHVHPASSQLHLDSPHKRSALGHNRLHLRPAPQFPALAPSLHLTSIRLPPPATAPQQLPPHLALETAPVHLGEFPIPLFFFQPSKLFSSLWHLTLACSAEISDHRIKATLYRIDMQIHSV